MERVFYQCGCCNQYHPAAFMGDCRDDSNRFNPEDLPEGWVEITQAEADIHLANIIVPLCKTCGSADIENVEGDALREENKVLRAALRAVTNYADACHDTSEEEVNPTCFSGGEAIRQARAALQKAGRE